MIRAAISEYKKIFRDFGALLILIAAPLFYALYYPFPYTDEIIRNIPAAVVDEDKSDLSRKAVRMIDSSESISVASQYPTLSEARSAFYSREVFGIIHIPRNFYKNVISGRQPTVTLFSDGSYMLFYSESFSSAMKILFTLSAGVKIQRMTMSGIPSDAALKIQSAANVMQKPLFNINGGYGTFVVPGVLALIVHQIMLVAMFLVMGSDYERKTRFEEGKGVISSLFGKTLTYSTLFAAIFAYFFLVSIHIFNIPAFGNRLTLFIFIIPYSLSTVFLGLFLSIFVKEREGGVLVVIMTSIPLLFLAGFSWPIWEMPQWVQYLRTVFPSSAGVLGVVMINQMGASLNDVIIPFINLWILTFVYMTLAIISFHIQIKGKSRDE